MYSVQSTTVFAKLGACRSARSYQQQAKSRLVGNSPVMRICLASWAQSLRPATTTACHWSTCPRSPSARASAKKFVWKLYLLRAVIFPRRFCAVPAGFVLCCVLVPYRFVTSRYGSAPENSYITPLYEYILLLRIPCLE